MKQFLIIAVCILFSGCATKSRVSSDSGPTLDEQVPGIATPGWTGLFVRKDTPPEAREVISRIAKKVVESDEAQKIAANTGAVVMWMPPEKAVPFMNNFYDRFKELLGF